VIANKGGRSKGLVQRRRNKEVERGTLGDKKGTTERLKNKRVGYEPSTQGLWKRGGRIEEKGMVTR